jgi:uncharacterized phage-associated protein
MTDSSSPAAPDGRAVANIMLDMAERSGRPLTIMQLLKVLFFAHAVSLVVRDQPLMEDRAQAWQYGPVFPRVYRAFGNAGRLPIQNRAIDKKTGKPFSTPLSVETIDIMKIALDKFGNLSAFKLSDISHAPGSPWDVTFREAGVYSEIPNKLIRDFYSEAAEIQSAPAA